MPHTRDSGVEDYYLAGKILRVFVPVESHARIHPRSQRRQNPTFGNFACSEPVDSTSRSTPTTKSPRVSPPTGDSSLPVDTRKY